jgi:hypothetical protein
VVILSDAEIARLVELVRHEPRLGQPQRFAMAPESQQTGE